MVWLDPVSKKILALHNLGREDDRYRKLNRTGEVFFATTAQARAKLRQQATKLGIPTSWQHDPIKI